MIILKNISGKYEEFHNVTFSDDAIKACVQLSDRYISDRFLPDKAIDVMDEVGARVHLKTFTYRDISRISKSKSKTSKNKKSGCQKSTIRESSRFER
jgi:ATP-dependent Clp protease ATP-binding subunit ClpC